MAGDFFTMVDVSIVPEKSVLDAAGAVSRVRVPKFYYLLESMSYSCADSDGNSVLFRRTWLSECNDDSGDKNQSKMATNGGRNCLGFFGAWDG